MERSKSPDAPGSKFHPSPTMMVRVGRGKVIAMNRRERRRQHLYGDRLIIKKVRPTPPAIYHSLEEARQAQH